jgi:hypothetical protein
MVNAATSLAKDIVAPYLYEVTWFLGWFIANFAFRTFLCIAISLVMLYFWAQLPPVRKRTDKGRCPVDS